MVHRYGGPKKQLTEAIKKGRAVQGDLGWCWQFCQACSGFHERADRQLARISMGFCRMSGLV
jgi:hypothetical protein